MNLSEYPPEHPPNPNNLLSKNPPLLLRILQSEKAREIIQRANEQYWYWEEFKSTAHHSEFSPAELWAFLKTSRDWAMKKLPLMDKQGHPLQFWLPDSALEDLQYIDKSLWDRSLQNQLEILPELKDQLWVNSQMEEAIASTQIDGAISNRNTAKEMLKYAKRPLDESPSKNAGSTCITP